MPFPHFGPVHAPELIEGLEWIGVPAPLKLSGLGGRLVLLDFWTYGCINCMHVIPRLRELEERFRDVLTVIGVHSGKFAHERATGEIATACARLGVHHPVVNDRQFRVWRAYAVEAWPTVALIDSQGYLVGVQPGEFDVGELAATIEQTAGRDKAAGHLVPGPQPFESPEVPPPGGALAFPTRVLAEGDRIWISDGGHGRVIEAAIDASRTSATVVAHWTGLDQPQGIARLHGWTYVAERAGHSVWRLAENGERVRVAGTGVLGDGRVRASAALESDLRSPWGLATLDDELVVTMAGSHQLFALDPGRGMLRLVAGSGAEDVTDGPARSATLAQPQGAVVDRGFVYFADAESPAVRVWDTATDRVSTLVGTGLFDFGDRDGIGDEVRLQHPAELALIDGKLAVADAYNGRLKLLDPATRECRAFPGEAGVAGSLAEPSGLFRDGERLLVADTNNHRIVSASSDGALTEIAIEE